MIDLYLTMCRGVESEVARFPPEFPGTIDSTPLHWVKKRAEKMFKKF